MDSLRGNVLVDVTPALEEAIESQPSACKLMGFPHGLRTQQGSWGKQWKLSSNKDREVGGCQGLH